MKSLEFIEKILVLRQKDDIQSGLEYKDILKNTRKVLLKINNQDHKNISNMCIAALKIRKVSKNISNKRRSKKCYKN